MTSRNSAAAVRCGQCSGVNVKMADCTFYREIEYTIFNKSDGIWRWDVHPSGPCSGEMGGFCKLRTEAIAAAELAIDEILTIQPN